MSITYNTSWQREQEEKKRYKGRGKYKRTLNQYFFDAYKRGTKERLEGGIAFGYVDLMRQRHDLYSRHKHTAYRIEVYNNTKHHKVK